MQHESEIGANVLIDDESLPQGFDGFRFVEEFESNAAPIVIVHYFVHDPQGSDIHQLLMAVQPDQAGEAESVMRDLLAQARWIEATPPSY